MLVHERFWTKVDLAHEDDDCWPWTAGTWRDRFGYGKFQAGTNRATNQAAYAHRWAYEWSNGPITDGLCVCHRCDNPLCCNPAHLWLGTRADNLADMRAKGRDRWSNRAP